MPYGGMGGPPRGGPRGPMGGGHRPPPPPMHGMGRGHRPPPPPPPMGRYRRYRPGCGCGGCMTIAAGILAGIAAVAVIITAIL